MIIKSYIDKYLLVNIMDLGWLLIILYEASNISGTVAINNDVESFLQLDPQHRPQ